MKRGWNRSIEPARRRELEIAAAVAREKVMQFHVGSALRLIALAGGRVPPVRMIEIHMRLHGITGAEAELLANRILAALGSTESVESVHLVLPTEPQPEGDPDSPWHALRSRLRGRVHHQLRRYIELAVGAAQAGIVHIHVEHALRFARELTTTHNVSEACAYYVELAVIPAPLRSAVYLGLVNRIANDELPRIAAPAPVAQASSARSRRLEHPRVVS